MNPVFLIDGCRSPIGRGHPEKGLYHNLRADELSVQVLQALIDRTELNPEQIDDFYLGCVGQHLEQGKNLARLIILLADLPETTPGATVNRLCSSSLTALQMATDSIRAGTNSQMLVGGVEHLGHVPMTAALGYHPNLFKSYDFQWTNMGLTAEKLSEDFGINRTEQDAFAMESNRRYFDACEAGFLTRERVPVTLPDGKVVTEDQEPRLSTLESLSGLRTVFKENGTVTAANSSGISDGACMAWIGDQGTVEQSGKEPLAEIMTTANVGLNPETMGLGPVSAIRKLLKMTGLSLDEIDLFEINEAFAVQVLACQRKLGIDETKLNIHGGAVALGHPLGMSGLRIAVTLAHSMDAQNAHYGIASLCVGHGQGVAMLLKR
ncbi:MAG: thiolase family protein [Candidatus Marinimicrobia bacterium]|jgi:acetyl-CoA acyltransferase|nr:acetyl-CoA C-acyltransferase [Nitrospinota bacterium]MDP6396902.1 thiolase family protein [Candidatus Neomarinimicrobiota bacterium]|tara:strand:+ start:4051 stop:5187 length:1137 start_codon:yes stop_codon:yes gene_type:complete